MLLKFNQKVKYELKEGNYICLWLLIYKNRILQCVVHCASSTLRCLFQEKPLLKQGDCWDEC